MGKIFTTPPPTVGKVVGRVQYSYPKQKTATIKGAGNNNRSPSVNYVPMNNGIIQLDAAFKELPLTGPPFGANQAAWQAASVNYIGVPVCGCLTKLIDGQKLFRLVNYLNLALGLAWTSIPPGFSFPLSSGLIPIEFNMTGGPPAPEVLFIAAGTLPAGFFVICQLGFGLLNPIIVMPPTTMNISIQPPDPRYAQLLTAIPRLMRGSATQQAFQMKVCQWNLDGSPNVPFEATCIYNP